MAAPRQFVGAAPVFAGPGASHSARAAVAASTAAYVSHTRHADPDDDDGYDFGGSAFAQPPAPREAQAPPKRDLKGRDVSPHDYVPPPARHDSGAVASALMHRMEEQMAKVASSVRLHDPTFKEYFESLHRAYFQTAYDAGVGAGKLMAPAPKCTYCERRKENNRMAAQVVREKQRDEKRTREAEEMQHTLDLAAHMIKGAGGKGLYKMAKL